MQLQVEWAAWHTISESNNDNNNNNNNYYNYN